MPVGRSSPGMGGVNGTLTKLHVCHSMQSQDLTANGILAQVRCKKVWVRRDGSSLTTDCTAHRHNRIDIQNKD